MSSWKKFRYNNYKIKPSWIVRNYIILQYIKKTLMNLLHLFVWIFFVAVMGAITLSAGVPEKIVGPIVSTILIVGGLYIIWRMK